MDVPSPQQRPAVLARYQQWRAIGRELNKKLVESLSGDDINEAGELLGLLHKGVLCFDTEDTVAVLMDYGIRHLRRGGHNAIDRYLAESPPADPEQLAWLQATSQSRYRILQAEEVYRGFGMRACDIFRDQTAGMIDIGFSQTVQQHDVMASHVYCLDGFWMTTGAALPVTADVLRRLVAVLERKFGRGPEDYRALAPERETELATLVIRTCLSTGMSQRVRYGEPTAGPHFGRGPVPVPAALAPQRERVGRNDPCPCGSGKKFKNCCLR